jgi:hypothetical protein
LEGKISWVTKIPFAWLLCQVDFSYVTQKERKKEKKKKKSKIVQNASSLG